MIWNNSTEKAAREEWIIQMSLAPFPQVLQAYSVSELTKIIQFLD